LERKLLRTSRRNMASPEKDDAVNNLVERRRRLARLLGLKV
jgi:hypothetical protein